MVFFRRSTFSSWKKLPTPLPSLWTSYSNLRHSLEGIPLTPLWMAKFPLWVGYGSFWNELLTVTYQNFIFHYVEKGFLFLHHRTWLLLNIDILNSATVAKHIPQCCLAKTFTMDWMFIYIYRLLQYIYKYILVFFKAVFHLNYIIAEHSTVSWTLRHNKWYGRVSLR